MDGAIARVGGLTFYGDRYRGHGFHIGPDGFTGWNDGVTVRRERIQRPAAHGEFDTPTYLGARDDVGIEGFVVARSLIELQHMNAQLLGLQGRSLQLSVEEGGRILRTVARVEARPRFDASGFYPDADYAVTFVCPDPHLYGDTHVFPEGEAANPVVAWHYGNTDAVPVLEVWGSSPTGYTITGPGGRQIVVTRSLTSMLPHTIDLATGGLFVDGVRQLGHMPTFQPWTIPPGQSVTVSMSTARVRVKVRDTFV